MAKLQEQLMPWLKQQMQEMLAKSTSAKPADDEFYKNQNETKHQVSCKGKQLDLLLFV